MQARNPMDRLPSRKTGSLPGRQAPSLEDAHWKLSKYCAQAAGMEDRGHLAVGMPADVLVYDLKGLRPLD